MSPINVKQSINFVENIGYDVPFVSYIWERWQEMRVHILLSVTHLQPAIEHRQLRLALSIAVEIQEINATIQTEVGMWIGVSKQ